MSEDKKVDEGVTIKDGGKVVQTTKEDETPDRPDKTKERDTH